MSPLDVVTLAGLVVLVGFLFGFGFLGAVDAWEVLVHWLRRMGWRTRS